ncbi:MAG: hypothetical protein A2322_09240 [Bacteroidetes bacterium RIFOXYB2_FULL_39_7]|nr:MAG: hypothetical protein A2322_09240 [Bacteroidetes bacterium RIFOXYB2_FULL_39_7]OGF48631.1 MAG: hypothetical protein A2231_01540 [Candidatus Firestonebacteria bacterium RIFOXYA2_FULL_40_8]
MKKIDGFKVYAVCILWLVSIWLLFMYEKISIDTTLIVSFLSNVFMAFRSTQSKIEKAQNDISYNTHHQRLKTFI